MPFFHKRIRFSSFLSSPSTLIVNAALSALAVSGCSSDVTRLSSNSFNLTDTSLSSSSNSSAPVKGPYSLGHNLPEQRYYSPSDGYDQPISRMDLPPPEAAPQMQTSSYENNMSSSPFTANLNTNAGNGSDTLYNLSQRSGLSQEELIRQNSLKGFSFQRYDRSAETSQKIASLSPSKGTSGYGERSLVPKTSDLSPQNSPNNASVSFKSEGSREEKKVETLATPLKETKSQNYTHTPLPLLPSEQRSALNLENEKKLEVADLKQGNEAQKSDAPGATAPTILNGQNLKEPNNITKDASQETKSEEQPSKETLSHEAELARLRWPVKGRITSPFGERADGTTNDGIDISVPLGTDIHAAEDGIVAYAGNQLPAYGNLVLVKHAKGVVTAYAHADQIKVKKGDRVTRGQIIATAGKTGAVDQPKLHFEVREGPKAVDPLMHLEKI